MVRRRSVPPKIFSNVEGTWAHDTVSRRLHEDILERVFVDNRNDIAKEGSEARKMLKKLREELKMNENVSHVEEDGEKM